MPACRPARWAVPGAAALAVCGAALAGCGAGSAGSSASTTGAAASGSPSSAAGQASASGALTGNFCTDFHNIGKNLPIPAPATGSLSALEQHDGRYLRQVAAYYDRLAAEAPAQAGQEIRLIASAYQGLAGSLASGSATSLSKIEQQMTSLTTSGAASKAFRQLIVYVATKCG